MLLFKLRVSMCSPRTGMNSLSTRELMRQASSLGVLAFSFLEDEATVKQDVPSLPAYDQLGPCGSLGNAQHAPPHNVGQFV